MPLFWPPNVDKMEKRSDFQGLLKVLEDKKESDPRWRADVRGKAALALSRLGNKDAIEPLIAALLDRDRFVRHDAAVALGNLLDARSVLPLINALTDEAPDVRDAAATALGKLGDARAVEPLIATLTNNAVGVQAVLALSRLGDARAVEPLIEVLKNPDSLMRATAADALGVLGDARALDPLIDALKDEELYVVAEAIKALGKIGSPRAVSTLAVMLKEPDTRPDMRKLCRAALQQAAESHPEERIDVLLRAAEHVYEDRQAERAGPAAGAGRRYVGGLGEPYCSQGCYARGAQFAMLEIPGASCGVCGRPVLSRRGERNYAVIPYEGKALVVCPSCVPGMRITLSGHTKCCVCQKPL